MDSCNQLLDTDVVLLFQEQPPSCKRSKGDVDCGDTSVGKSEGQAPELNNAKMKLTSEQTCGLLVDVGSSWFKALETEFSKPYFLQVGLLNII